MLPDLYAAGKPIQYEYMEEPLNVWDQQTIFAGPPLSVEPPSSAFALTWQQMLRLQAKGVGVAAILHGAGISTSGSEDLDKLLPLTEWFEVPTSTVALIKAAKHQNRKVVALGTSVVRALESAAVGGEIVETSGFTSLKLTPHTKRVVVDALISGLHEPGTSHLELSKAFCSQELIERAYQQAMTMGYRNHEYGDLSFLSCS